jgi:hypothetical protein
MIIAGIALTMGGRDWTVPPLTLGQLRRLMPKVRQLSAISATMDEDHIGTLVEIVAAALQRNYPEITTQAVEEMLDLGNAASVLSAVLSGSGLKSRETASGEPAAVASLEMTGDKSTVFSPPPAASPIP